MKYKLGLILGRFQIFHKGHESIVDKALELCDKVLVFIGSSQASGDYDNPFTYETRKVIIEEVYGDKLIIAPLKDLGVGNVSLWGDYVMNSAKEVVGELPDVVFYGEEDKCKTWYNNYPNANFYKLDRGIIPTSTTLIKEHILDNDYEYFKKYMNERLWKYYSDMRIAVTKYKYKKERELSDDFVSEMLIKNTFEDEE